MLRQDLVIGITISIVTITNILNLLHKQTRMHRGVSFTLAATQLIIGSTLLTLQLPVSALVYYVNMCIFIALGIWRATTKTNATVPS